MWFKSGTQFTVTDDFVRVGVPNHFIGGWIERHYSDAILRAARDVLGRDVQLTYALDPHLTRKLGKTILNSQAAAASPPEKPRMRSPMEFVAAPRPRRLRGRLDTFVVGPANRMAYNAALEIAELRPGAPSPLFLHGGVGLGKTHLLQGIANAVEDRGAGLRWLSVCGEEFTNQFLTALRHKRLDEFRRRYRDLDLLLVDDIHFLANKRATQDEFLHTFNAIDTLGKRLVLASDAPPKMIGQMSEALISRFSAGMVVRLDTPDFDMRCDILRRRAASTGAGAGHVPDTVIAYIAHRIRSNVRELEGALVRVLALASMAAAPVTLDLARQSLEEHVARTEPLLAAEKIESTAATFFGLTPADLHTSRKGRTIALARSVAMYLTRKHTALSYPEIGRQFGNKNHSTVLFACRRVDDMIENRESVRYATAGGAKDVPISDLLGQLESALAP